MVNSGAHDSTLRQRALRPKSPATWLAQLMEGSYRYSLNALLPISPDSAGMILAGASRPTMIRRSSTDSTLATLSMCADRGGPGRKSVSNLYIFD